VTGGRWGFPHSDFPRLRRVREVRSAGSTPFRARKPAETCWRSVPKPAVTDGSAQLVDRLEGFQRSRARGQLARTLSRGARRADYVGHRTGTADPKRLSLWSFKQRIGLQNRRSVR
jgi:hypothetical protein